MPLPPVPVLTTVVFRHTSCRKQFRLDTRAPARRCVRGTGYVDSVPSDPHRPGTPGTGGRSISVVLGDVFLATTATPPLSSTHTLSHHRQRRRIITASRPTSQMHKPEYGYTYNVFCVSEIERGGGRGRERWGGERERGGGGGWRREKERGVGVGER